MERFAGAWIATKVTSDERTISLTLRSGYDEAMRENVLNFAATRVIEKRDPARAGSN
jgi:hypothetical protein